MNPFLAGAREVVLLSGGIVDLGSLEQPIGRNTARESIVFKRTPSTRGSMNLQFKFRYYERTCVDKNYSTQSEPQVCSQFEWVAKSHKYKLRLDFKKAFGLRRGENESFEVSLRQPYWHRKQVALSVKGISTTGEYIFKFKKGWMVKPELWFIKN